LFKISCLDIRFEPLLVALFEFYGAFVDIGHVTMVGSSEKLRLKRLLSEAIVLLCKNGLPFSNHFCLEALIGVTLDREEVSILFK